MNQNLQTKKTQTKKIGKKFRHKDPFFEKVNLQLSYLFNLKKIEYAIFYVLSNKLFTDKQIENTFGDFVKSKKDDLLIREEEKSIQKIKNQRNEIIKNALTGLFLLGHINEKILNSLNNEENREEAIKVLNFFYDFVNEENKEKNHIELELFFNKIQTTLLNESFLPL